MAWSLPPSVPLLALLLGCGGPPETLADCDDLDCQRTWVLERWPTDAAATASALGGLSDPVARLALVNALVEAHPGQTGELCRLLPQGDAQLRCQQLNARPHLWQVPDHVLQTGASADETDSIETVGLELLQPTAPLPSPWATTAPRVVPCDGATSQCQSLDALRAARLGARDEAASACLAIDEDRWRQECFFQAADAIVAQPSPARGVDAVKLCLGAPGFLSRCLTHIQWASASLAPIAPAAKAEDWAPMRAFIETTTTELRPLEPALADRFEQLLWAEALRVGYDQVEKVNGAPLAALEPALAPHVRAAAIRRLLSLELGVERSLEDWGARIEEALAKQTPEPTRRYRDPIKNKALSYLWRGTLPGEEALQTTVYFAGGRRALAADPKIDALVCLLEAAALLPRPKTSLLEDALDHEDRLVRWTAARLLADDDPQNERLRERLRLETDPLVRARLDTRVAPGTRP